MSARTPALGVAILGRSTGVRCMHRAASCAAISRASPPNECGGDCRISASVWPYEYTSMARSSSAVSNRSKRRQKYLVKDDDNKSNNGADGQS